MFKIRGKMCIYTNNFKDLNYNFSDEEYKLKTINFLLHDFHFFNYVKFNYNL